MTKHNSFVLASRFKALYLRLVGLIFRDTDEKALDPKATRLRATLLSLPLAFMGLFALVLLVHDGLHGGLDRQHATGLLSAAVVCGGLIALIFGITAKKEALMSSASTTDDGKPWLKRKDWAEGRIATSTRNFILLLWIFVAFWCAASAVILIGVVPRQLHQGDHAALIALVLPLITLAIVFFALTTTFTWRKFNRCLFQMAAFPAPLGGVLVGKIQVPGKLRPRHGFHLRLNCARRKTDAKGRPVEKILWRDEKWLRADLPQTGSNATGIPVFFKLPDGLPDSSFSSGDGIHWKLEAFAKLRGPDFHAAFDVPVFKLPEAPAPSDDPTAPFQMSLDEVRQQIRSLVETRDLADGGREFIFPAARNPGFAFGASVVCLVWTAIIAVLLWKRAPLPFLLVLSAMDFLMAGFVVDLWFRRSCVTVNSKGVLAQKAWFSFKREQRFPAGEISSIATDVGATVGHASYHDLKILTRDGKDFVLAKHLDNKPEADWLVRQMITALKPPS